MTEKLTRFFRENHQVMGLPDDFGAVYEGMKHIYIWNLPGNDSGEVRNVELRIYPEKNVIEVLAQITPKDFREKYRQNTKVVGVAKFKDLDSCRIWIENHLRRASHFARHEHLLNVSEADAMPGTYRNTL